MSGTGVPGQRRHPRQRHVGVRRDAEGAADHHPQLRLALAEPASLEHHRRRDRLPAQERALVGGLVVGERLVRHAVAGQVDQPGAQPVGAAVPQRGERVRRGRERGDQGDVRAGLQRLVVGVDLVLGLEPATWPFGHHAPPRPREQRVVEVEVLVTRHRRGGRALDVALVVGDHERRRGPVTLRHGIRTDPLAQAAEALAVLVDVEAVAAGEVLGVELGRGGRRRSRC